MGSIAARAGHLGLRRAGCSIWNGRAGGQCAWLAPAGFGVQVGGLIKLHVQFSYSGLDAHLETHATADVHLIHPSIVI